MGSLSGTTFQAMHVTCTNFKITRTVWIKPARSPVSSARISASFILKVVRYINIHRLTYGMRRPLLKANICTVPANRFSLDYCWGNSVSDNFILRHQLYRQRGLLNLTYQFEGDTSTRCVNIVFKITYKWFPPITPPIF